MAAAVQTRLDHLEGLAREFPDLPLEVIVKEDVLTEGVRLDSGVQAPEIARILGGPLELRPTVLRLWTNPASHYQLRALDDGCLQLIDLPSGQPVADARRYPERPAYQAKRSSAGLPMVSLMDAFGRVSLPLQHPKDPAQVAEAAIETFMLEKWQSHESPLAIRLQPEPALFELEDPAQEEFVLRYVHAIHQALGNQRPILLEMPPKEWDIERRLFQAGVTGRISAMEVWAPAVFSRLGPKYAGVDRDAWIARILGQAHIYLENLAQPLLAVGKELLQPGGFLDQAQALESTMEGIRFFLKHRVCVRLAHWVSPLGGSGAPVQYHLQLARFWYESWVREYRAEPGGELLGPGWSRDPDSAALDIGRGAGLVTLR